MANSVFLSFTYFICKCLFKKLSIHHAGSLTNRFFIYLFIFCLWEVELLFGALFKKINSVCFSCFGSFAVLFHCFSSTITAREDKQCSDRFVSSRLSSVLTLTTRRSKRESGSQRCCHPNKHHVSNAYAEKQHIIFSADFSVIRDLLLVPSVLQRESRERRVVGEANSKLS